ncbi:MAG: energy transducer TonB [Gammaproteobacteria bacterium]|nr:energy transducer TonB [Gammaproteobacteria bacterium]
MKRADEELDAGRDLLGGLVPVLGVGVIVTLAGIAGYWMYSSMNGEPPPPPPKVQEISLVKPPPPPPPPEEKPPEPPPMEEEKVEVPEPEPVPEQLPDAPSDEPPPGTELGLDAEGGAGSDGFGLKGRKGGRGLLSGGGDARAWYARVVQQDIQNRLSQIEDVRTLDYTVVVKLWLTADGLVQSAVLERGTGNSEVDLKLQNALSGGFRLSEAPPADLPQPIRLRIRSRS